MTKKKRSRNGKAREAYGLTITGSKGDKLDAAIAAQLAAAAGETDIDDASAILEELRDLEGKALALASVVSRIAAKGDKEAVVATKHLVSHLVKIRNSIREVELIIIGATAPAIAEQKTQGSAKQKGRAK